ncbi:MAG: 3-isopropylmalate dehydratase small subunit, partial [Myxococcota bacterium]
ISADVVLPARHSFLAPEQMAEQVLLDLGPEANRKVREHPVLVAGEAFGYGTGRESPCRALRAAGVRAVVANSFSRLFFRNAMNNGIVVVQCPALVKEGVQDGDDIEIALAESVVRWKGKTFAIAPFSDVVAKIVEAGSLINYGRALLAAEKA